MTPLAGSHRLTKVRVFVASPGDVTPERDSLGSVITSLAKTKGFAEQFGLTIELLRWETHVTPDVGRIQGLVFKDIEPDTWDIFVGILWKRFGTPTGAVDPATGDDYKSGTEEEFKAALRWRAAREGALPKIMMYRCVRDVDPRTLDATQFSLVQQFFRDFEPGGAHPGLVVPFKQTSEFERRVRDDIEQSLAELARVRAPSPAVGEASVVQSVSLRRMHPVGMLRYLFDRLCPRLHTWLSVRAHLLDRPPEWDVLHRYLSATEASITADIHEKTYVEADAKALPENMQQFSAKRTGFPLPIQQLVREVVSRSHGGDAQNARLSAISKKSRFVRNIAKRLRKAQDPLILLGDPGTGKSLTLLHTALLLTSAERRRMFPSICLFVRLGEFRSDNPTVDAVWDYVKRVAPEELRPYLDDLGGAGRLIIFFDGMDEMSRDKYNEHTTALSLFASQQRDYIRTLFSCRIADFTPRFQHRRLVLLPFSQSQISQYLKRQMTFPVTISGERWKSPRKLAARLAQSDQPMQANNPFVLWLLCAYLRDEKKWPESRVQLLEYYNQRNYQRKALAGAEFDSQRFSEMTRTFLAWGRLALEITSRNRGSAIELEDVRGALTEEQLQLVQIGINCGILQKSLDLEREAVRFEHHRFQEFFTAYYLHRQKEEHSGDVWLKRLDAPRWQETLFNLILMGSGREALTPLTSAIGDATTRLEDDVDSDGEVSPVGSEALLGDRVELASRILQQARTKRELAIDQLSAVFSEAVYRLASVGNPITQVKMLWAASAVPNVDIFRVARQPLQSPVAWVRQQAQLLTSIAAGEVGSSAFMEDLQHSVAAGRFLQRLGGFVRIARALKGHAVWVALTAAFVLSLAPLAAAYVVALNGTRVMMPPARVISDVQSRALQKRYADQLRKARDNADPQTVEEMREAVTSSVKVQAAFEHTTFATERVAGTFWFRGLLTLAIILCLLSVQERPGWMLIAVEGASGLLLTLPLLLWPLWNGSWGEEFWALFFVIPANVLVLEIAAFAGTLAAQMCCLTLFVGTCALSTGSVHNKRALVSVCWEEFGFADWLSAIWRTGYAFALVSGGTIMLVLTLIDWQGIGAMVAHFLGIFPRLPNWVNVSLSLLIYWEALGLLTVIAAGILRRNAKDIRYLSWTWAITAIVGMSLILLFWRGFDSIGILLLWLESHLSFFGALPRLLSDGLSISIYVEAIALLASLQHWRRPGAAARVVARGSVVSASIALTSFLIYFAVHDWRAIVAALGVFHFLSPRWNFLLSVTLYAEIGAGIYAISLLKSEAPRPLSHHFRPNLRIAIVFVAIAFLIELGEIIIRYQSIVGQALVLISVILLLIVLIALSREAVSVLAPVVVVFIKRDVNDWKQQIVGKRPAVQAARLRGTTPELLNLQPGEFLDLLEEMEPVFTEEPALSTYWTKRFQLEQIVRQERVGS